jgi:predicted nucleotidyltransferase
MRRVEAMQRLEDVLPVARQRFGVRALSVFGSVARDEAKEASDVDILVDFEGPATLLGFMGLKLYLEERLGARVDLVTRPALKPVIKQRIEAEAIRVA